MLLVKEKVLGIITKQVKFYFFITSEETIQFGESYHISVASSETNFAG